LTERDDARDARQRLAREYIQFLEEKHPRLLLVAALEFGAITQELHDELLGQMRQKEEAARVKAQLRVLHGP